MNAPLSKFNDTVLSVLDKHRSKQKQKKKRNIQVQTIAIYDKKEVRKVIMNISKLRDELKLKTSIPFNRQKISVLVCFLGN